MARQTRRRFHFFVAFYNRSSLFLKMKPAVDAALAAGYRLFDTARVYDNESDLGRALEVIFLFISISYSKVCLPLHNLERGDVFLTTKIYPSDSAHEVHDMVEDSLRNLRTSYIDLMLIHFPKTKGCALDDSQNALHRKITYLALDELRSEGKIRSIGVSNYEPHHIEEIKAYGKEMPSVSQAEFHPHFTRPKLLDYCREENIFFQAYSSLARHTPDLLEHTAVLELASRYKTSPSIILLSWALSQGTGIIPKSSNPERIVSNLKVRG
ncbi:unnamed protein product [Heligmosomoides polygyrus]|uniref:Aldo_ket_red domain-containing protein n=1 Tax=Heligmosomoides polygyrus TaxID=6339 RepID=A0A183G6P0_HELPZ|nr:unnamed protein product [Heligmosomoides polygyrus]